ncbi:tRNA dihydrouridine synthase DusB [Brockia lithotrophica]|uniref:tRNA-dihydrouridine synthase n=1 Tax=Brockia lithotrophica TaxID=933949 RepID=A0A660KXS2_9BACL|nr:tRNA dihydrouridine synthase DusB [Brockia lithotrophica]RKQ85613.1 tRNA-U20-dihydrouridine synthase [Brockia lithotrophica]
MAWKLAHLTLDTPVVLAPMAGVTNVAFRVLARRLGASLIYTEMVSADGIVRRNPQTRQFLVLDPAEHPVALQIFGNDISVLAEAARIVEAETDADIIDVNLGCPAPKVVKNFAGAAWLREPRRVEALFRALTDAVRLPVTAKIRLGWDERSITAVEVALAVEAGGGAAVAVHARTRAQGYSGNVDWSWIRRVRAAVSIPVIGNGDVRSPEDAKRMLEETGADAVMIGRAALGNPWILHRTVHYLQTGELLPEPTAEERIALAREHLARLVALKGEAQAVREMRRHLAWYLKGLPQAARLREEAVRVQSLAEVEALFARVRETSLSHAETRAFSDRSVG